MDSPTQKEGLTEHDLRMKEETRQKKWNNGKEAHTYATQLQGTDRKQKKNTTVIGVPYDRNT
jgi:hypothetical protein